MRSFGFDDSRDVLFGKFHCLEGVVVFPPAWGGVGGLVFLDHIGEEPTTCRYKLLSPLLPHVTFRENPLEMYHTVGVMMYISLQNI